MRIEIYLRRRSEIRATSPIIKPMPNAALSIPISGATTEIAFAKTLVNASDKKRAV
jgi:hypothetical protein